MSPIRPTKPSGTTGSGGNSNRVLELIRLLQSKKSPGHTFFDGEPTTVTSTPIAHVVGEDAAHALCSILSKDPWEAFTIPGAIDSVKEVGDESKIIPTLEFLLSEPDSDAVVKGRITQALGHCYSQGIESERALEILLSLLKDSDSAVVSSAIDKLNSPLHNQDSPNATVHRITQAYIETFNEHSNELGSNQVRSNTVDLLRNRVLPL